MNEDGNYSQLKYAMSFSYFEQINRGFHISNPNKSPKPVKTQEKKNIRDRKILIYEKVIKALVFIIYNILNIYLFVRILSFNLYLRKTIKE